jgi:hypothetical protein
VPPLQDAACPGEGADVGGDNLTTFARSQPSITIAPCCASDTDGHTSGLRVDPVPTWPADGGSAPGMQARHPPAFRTDRDPLSANPKADLRRSPRFSRVILADVPDGAGASASFAARTRDRRPGNATRAFASCAMTEERLALRRGWLDVCGGPRPHVRIEPAPLNSTSRSAHDAASSSVFTSPVEYDARRTWETR